MNTYFESRFFMTSNSNQPSMPATQASAVQDTTKSAGQSTKQSAGQATTKFSNGTAQWNLRTNLSLLTDFYELTMANGYAAMGNANQEAIFDVFFRHIPEQGGYALMAGVEQIVDYLENLHFSEEDLEYLRSLHTFSEEFLEILRDFQFSCSVWAVEEGMPIFPGEPIVKVRGPLWQCQLIETMLLICINHQCLIATKASRVMRAANGRVVMEFGARRAQGFDASVLGARAAYIGGVTGTSCTIASQLFGIPAMGTMAHSWVQSFPSQYEAFVAYAKVYPKACNLLIDTYDTLRQGIPDAIRCAKEYLEPRGERLKGVRIDSGDLTYLSVQARKMLDEAGLQDCKITVSNGLDEYIISELIRQGAAVDSFGVGERLITAKSQPIFGAVYKMAGMETSAGEMKPKMKISNNVEKITNPGSKIVYRLYDNESGMAVADLICLEGETIDPTQPLEIFDPIHTWKRKLLTNFSARQILQPIFDHGKCVYTPKKVSEIRDFAAEQLSHIWETMRRFENPEPYYVDLSEPLWTLKNQMLRDLSSHEI